MIPQKYQLLLITSEELQFFKQCPSWVLTSLHFSVYIVITKIIVERDQMYIKELDEQAERILGFTKEIEDIVDGLQYTIYELTGKLDEVVSLVTNGKVKNGSQLSQAKLRDLIVQTLGNTDRSSDNKKVSENHRSIFHNIEVVISFEDDLPGLQETIFSIYELDFSVIRKDSNIDRYITRVIKEDYVGNQTLHQLSFNSDKEESLILFRLSSPSFIGGKLDVITRVKAGDFNKIKIKDGKVYA